MIEYLEIKNFRNFEQQKITFSSSMTFLEGLNGSGKTSILEAIYFVSLLKSFRASDDKLLINNNKSFAKIVLKTGDNLFEVVISDSSKHLKINNKVITKMSDFISRFKAIVFSPNDLKLVQGLPGFRRHFMDVTMVQLTKKYLDNLTVYRKVLKERNALLKHLKPKDDLTFLKIINKRLALEADQIIEGRMLFIKKLNKSFIERFKSFNPKDRVNLIYQPNSPLNSLEMILNERFERDLVTQSTSAGPHRDDFLIEFNRKPAKEFASQGQTRLIAIALKLALVDLFERDQDVVILLDDVLSELDDDKKHEIEKLFTMKKQIILTGTKSEYKNVKTINLDRKRN
ncbi:MAG: DNA replication and repair protein RecF [Acholeplasmataceae bacterium]|jgi:DNA replication and repair protein RecF|nr:DNA replication and repair protein RecF [Acholeplasmataceae bacterium]